MSRAMKITVLILLLAVAGGLIYVRGLHERILRLARPERAERQAVRELTKPAAAPTDAKIKARLFWASKEQAGALAPVELELPLSAEPVTRARQVIETLVAQAPSPEQRTLPVEAVLLEFYLLPDGTAIADFSGALASETPSGILSEQLAVESILRTLEANVERVRKLKMLIQGQEVETLAGHLDLSGFFTVRMAPPAEPEKSTTPGEKPAAPKLTAQSAGGKLSR